jgi:hypothetical protein
MTDAQVGKVGVTQDATVAQPGDGKSLLEHSGWLDHLKHGATTFGHKAENLLHKGVEKGKEIAHDPKNQKIAHEVAHEALQAGKEVAADHVRRVKAVGNAAEHGDIGGAVRQGLPLVGEALAPHAAAVKIVKDQAAEIAERHASPAVRSEIEKRKEAADQKQNQHIKHVPHLVIDGITSTESAKH